MELNQQNGTENSVSTSAAIATRENDVTEIDLVELFYCLLRSWKLLLLALIKVWGSPSCHCR